MPKIAQAATLAAQAEEQEREAIEEAKRALQIAYGRGKDAHSASQIAAEAARRALQEQAERDRLNHQKRLEFEKELGDLDGQIGKMKDLLADLKSQCDKEKANLDALKAALDDANRKLQEALQALADAKKEHDRLRKELDDLLAALEKARRELAEAKKETANQQELAEKAKREAEAANRQRAVDEEAAKRAQKAAEDALKAANEAAANYQKQSALAAEAEAARKRDEDLLGKLKLDLSKVLKALEEAKSQSRVVQNNSGKAAQHASDVKDKALEIIKGAQERQSMAVKVAM